MRTLDIVLVAGLWLDGSAWDEVAPPLHALGHRPVPITLPGQGDGAPTASLADQAAAVVDVVDAAPGQVMVVGHSAAATLAWLAADARPDRLARAVLIGGFPCADGEPYADFFQTSDGWMPFPGWEPFEGADTADLDDDTRRRVAAATVPVPEPVSKGVVRYHDERRYDVPVTLVCPEFSPDQAREWVDAGDLPELARARHLDLVDLDSGHWPMFSRPDDLARLLASLADRRVG